MSVYKGIELLAGVATNTISNAHSLFDFMWSDHIKNEMSWLRANTFSWQSGAVYVSAYNHLVADYNGGTSQTETVGSYTITYVLADDGHKITTDETTVANIYNESGVAWYYILDTTNTRFKLPRENPNVEKLNISTPIKTSSTDTITWSSGISPLNIKKCTTGLAGGENRNLSVEGGTGSVYYTSTSGGSIADRLYPSNLYADNSNSTSVYKGKKYLYFYVGQFSQSATEQTAGLNSELFNGKLDLDLGNITNNSKETIVGWGMPNGSSIDLTFLSSGVHYTAPANGFYNIGLTLNGWVNVVTSAGVLLPFKGNGVYASCLIQVKKNDEMWIDYSGATKSTLLFIYAGG